jgi:hypothetical protein
MSLSIRNLAGYMTAVFFFGLRGEWRAPRWKLRLMTATSTPTLLVLQPLWRAVVATFSPVSGAAPGDSSRYLGRCSKTGQMRGGLSTGRQCRKLRCCCSLLYLLPLFVGVEMMGWEGRRTYFALSIRKVTVATISVLPRVRISMG